MTYLDDPGAGMTSVSVFPVQVVVIQLEIVERFRRECPREYAKLIECSAIVNWRRLEQGGEAILCLSFRS